MRVSAVHTLKLAAAHLPRVDAIGGSSAGVYINNKVRVASLFRGVAEKSPELFDSKVKNMFLDVAKEWCVSAYHLSGGGAVAVMLMHMDLLLPGVFPSKF